MLHVVESFGQLGHFRLTGRRQVGRIELAPEPIVADVARLREALSRSAGGFLLIGRRHLRSNNSWMHNLPALRGGTNRCTLQMHPATQAFSSF